MAAPVGRPRVITTKTASNTKPFDTVQRSSVLLTPFDTHRTRMAGDWGQPIPVTKASLEAREYTPAMVYTKAPHNGTVDFHQVDPAANADPMFVGYASTPEMKVNTVAVFKGPIGINGSLKTGNPVKPKMFPVAVFGMTPMRNTGKWCLHTGTAVRVRMPIYDTNDDQRVKFEREPDLVQMTAVVEPFLPHNVNPKPVNSLGYDWKNRLAQVNFVTYGGDPAHPGQLVHGRVLY